MLGSDFYSLFVCLGVTISFSRYALSRGLPPRYAGEDWHRRWPQTSYCKYDMKAQGALSDLNFPLFQYPNPYTNLPNWPPQKSFPVDLSESNPGPCKASNLYVHSITWNGKFPCPPCLGSLNHGTSTWVFLRSIPPFCMWLVISCVGSWQCLLWNRS